MDKTWIWHECRYLIQILILEQLEPFLDKIWVSLLDPGAGEQNRSVEMPLHTGPLFYSCSHFCQFPEFSIFTWAGQYCLVKGGRCILCDQGSVLEILGPGGRHIGNFGPGWAAYWYNIT